MTRKAGFHENASITKPGDDPAALPVPKLHPAYLDRSGQEQLLAELRDIIRQAPLFPPRMPRTGSPFSVRMTNCGRLGWVSDISGYRYQDGLGYYQSIRDTSTNFFMDYLPKGTYVFEYSTRIQHKGKYQTGIAAIQCMYAPEFNSHSQSFELEVE